MEHNRVCWTVFKGFIESRQDDIIMIECATTYILIPNEFRHMQCVLDKNPTDTTDLLDFETNYKAGCNKPISAIKVTLI